MEKIPATDFNQLLVALSGQFDVRDVNGSDQPIFMSVAFPTRDGVTGLKPRLPSGRGFTRGDARLAAAAEALELVSSLAGKETVKRFAVITKGGVDFVSATNMATGATQLIEAQKVFLDYAGVFNQTLIMDADSTGCACGDDFEDAKLRGLLECIERDAVAIWWYGRQSRQHLPLAMLDKSQPRLCYWLAGRSRRSLLIDATSDIGVPVVVAVSSEADGSHVALGSAADHSLQGAATKALSEMIQMETSMRLSPQAENTELDEWLAKASTRHMPQFQPAAASAEMSNSLEDAIQSCVAKAGFQTLAINLTPPGCPAACARVVVPGLSGLRNHKNLVRIHASNQGDQNRSSPAELEIFDPY
jgi:ribosomal protein S12 methylthiotransferase accessory factor YcaO